MKLANSEILANPISVKSKGEKTTVSLRPERALINPKDKMDNIHNGKIEEVIYHGDHTRVRINLLGNPEFISESFDPFMGLQLELPEDDEDTKKKHKKNNNMKIKIILFFVIYCGSMTILFLIYIISSFCFIYKIGS